MAKRALIEKWPWLAASLGAAIAFYVLRLSSAPGLWLIALKGACCALLALYAWQHKAGRDARTLASMMAVAALGDMAVEIDFTVGAMLFFIYHLLAMSLYLQHPREHATPTQKGAAVAMLLVTPLLAWLLPADRTMAWSTALYGFALGGMASSAWMSGFPRYRVGVGAVLFLASDLLLIARMGPLAADPLPDALVWPLYYVGQFLITVGIMQALHRRSQASRVA